MESGGNTHHTLQEILRFALSQKTSEDEENHPSEMNNESKEFLENAIKTMTVDVIKEFENAVNILENPCSVPLEKINALQVIRGYIENIDFANNFLKVGGSQIILNLLIPREENRIRVNAIYIIAEMSQNNITCQKHFVDANLLPHLLSYLTDDDDDIVCSSLHAISSLIKNFELGAVEFLNVGGINGLLTCLNTKCTRIFSKACYIIGNLSLTYPVFRDEFIKKSAFETLLEHLEIVNGFDVKLETLLFALSELSKSNVGKLTFHTKQNILDVLNKIIEQNKQNPSCEEIVSYAKTIIENIDKKP